jgi:hypothetical protein
LVPFGEKITYWLFWFEVPVVLPKCAEALIASRPICGSVAAAGAEAALSY